MRNIAPLLGIHLMAMTLFVGCVFVAQQRQIPEFYLPAGMLLVAVAGTLKDIFEMLWQRVRME